MGFNARSAFACSNRRGRFRLKGKDYARSGFRVLQRARFINSTPLHATSCCYVPRHAPSHRSRCRSFSSLLASLLPRSRGSSGFRGVSECPSSTFYVKIRFGNMRLGLDTFDTADEAARTYDPAAWRLNRPRRDMDFPEVVTREWAQRLAPPPRVVTEEDRRQNRRLERHLGIADMDEYAMRRGANCYRMPSSMSMHSSHK
ncbi:Ethylene-responsive transcription factor CRF1 [Hordeum vulgare]|nr:Ethylene-responsive transcription factor CRF1 [Hordeum vulgare]